MTIFEQSRYYFNFILPEIIRSNLSDLNTFLSHGWWIFLLMAFMIMFFYLLLLKKNLKLQQNFNRFNNYLHNLSLQQTLKEVDIYILKTIELIDAKFCGLYELRGDIYVLIESNTAFEKSVAMPIRIGKKELKNFAKSGNFIVSSYINSSEKNMLIYFSKSKINFHSFGGYFDIILSYYEEIAQSFKTQGEGRISNVSRDTSISLMKLQMDKQQFFKFFVALVLKITKVKGAKLLTKSDDLVFEYKPEKPTELQKLFYIRNTPYKLEMYDDKNLKSETVGQVGSFLDMAGSFLMNSDKNSEIVQNYIELLNFTNDAIELENVYYHNHSLIVQTVAVELASSLFLSQHDIDTIFIGAQLHDIGMIGDLLAMLDQDSLEEQEMNLIKEHPLIGSILVEPIAHIYPIVDIVKFHHERYDGKGYPLGLK